MYTGKDIKDIRKKFNLSINEFAKKIKKPDGKPVTPNTIRNWEKDEEKTIENANDLCMYLLNKAHVALVSGSAFGNPECIRISYAAADDKLIEAAKRMKEKLAELE